ncbi:hypothetical protein EGR_01733 [Echinococcus granulosus]|uniref:Uncharacterized protein n=1 Tax=Echinococcus granulosus TaxID=6210 RepID=W6UXG5_ECHGR|nr:hypothetical protein EGR_01733 [Echinococcus granulosus]EUB63242.1 hypothetical protein EGR_01733 [Echinococcus granulosus]
MRQQPKPFGVLFWTTECKGCIRINCACLKNGKNHDLLICFNDKIFIQIHFIIKFATTSDKLYPPVDRLVHSKRRGFRATNVALSLPYFINTPSSCHCDFLKLQEKWITWLSESDRSNRLSTQRMSDLFAAVDYFVLNFLHCGAFLVMNYRPVLNSDRTSIPDLFLCGF